ncbi:DNA-binding response regulator [Chryseobacterium indologenes]|uniref:DNA-binding response regulator n=1 Tax=Chryseobacterium indologenes TaxID=253 RepID=A0AAD0YUQ9_CHRID|nr:MULTISPECIES: response regulator transcription factor [Chryseobacterium]ATN06932.1 DNA-binding response regulator [Chryseobacterium indologenes]AYY84323.1 DNA-binding response regulator [Chryseobacterium indologenes]AYZ34080.1 DNA-binding response regulator [Chryseobacterium indologenes]AZB18720.1 DNA-binding response regulator [Chryseobacterium indologenes]MBF6642591.1 response regulator transcription factor [Chryseobacterium indologenes]
MKILIVEDEPELKNVVQKFLEAEHFIVEYADTYHAGLEKIISYEYDCILLDIMLPDGNGIDLLKEIKKMHKKDPVIILSAKDSVDDKVAGLEIGADDYLAKPFHLAELMARIKSVIRRNHQDGENIISYKNISIDPDNRKVMVAGEELLVNRKEYDLLYYFVIHPEKTLQKTTLAEAIWGDYIDQADSLDFIYSQIKNLRKKLKASNAEADFQAVYGIGYKFV